MHRAGLHSGAEADRSGTMTDIIFIMTAVILIEKLMDTFCTSFPVYLFISYNYILIYTKIVTPNTMAPNTGQTSLAGVQQFIYRGRPLTDDDDKKRTVYAFVQLLKTK